jgi:hypothetical protein
VLGDTSAVGKANQEDENLRRWFASGEPARWIADKEGKWIEHDWALLLDHLRQGEFWPIDELNARLQVGAARDEFVRAQEDAKSRVDTAQFDRPALYYSAGLGFVGAATGFFAGASNTPIVGTLLLLLFGLIGGTGGLYLASADLTSPSTGWRIRWLGTALTFFGTLCLAGSAVGITARLYVAHASKATD